MSVLGGTQRSWPMPDQRLSAYLRVCELFQILFCTFLYLCNDSTSSSISTNKENQIFGSSRMRPTSCAQALSKCLLPLPLHNPACRYEQAIKTVWENNYITRTKPKNDLGGPLIWCHSLKHSMKSGEREENDGWHYSSHPRHDNQAVATVQLKEVNVRQKYVCGWTVCDKGW